MCPGCVRMFGAQTTTKCSFTGTLGKPSDGLEPSTPSLPWRFWSGNGGHYRALAGTMCMRIGWSARVGCARACQDVLGLMYPCGTRGVLSDGTTDNIMLWFGGASRNLV